MSFPRFGRRFIGLIVVAAIAMMQVSSTWATIEICNTDPVLYFSDGSHISVTVITQASGLRELNFNVNAPRGLTLERVVSTGLPAGVNETVNVVFDQPAGMFIAASRAIVEGPAVPVDTILEVLQDSANASGQSGEWITVRVQ
ncbi:MAG: hypothetical protein NVS4B8_29990 [Herpetosiphon sp.]